MESFSYLFHSVRVCMHAHMRMCVVHMWVSPLQCSKQPHPCKVKLYVSWSDNQVTCVTMASHSATLTWMCVIQSIGASLALLVIHTQATFVHVQIIFYWKCFRYWVWEAVVKHTYEPFQQCFTTLLQLKLFACKTSLLYTRVPCTQVASCLVYILCLVACCNACSQQSDQWVSWQ